MNKNLNAIVSLSLALSIFFFFAPVIVFGQAPNDPGGDPDNAVPIDGGALGILLAAGVGYTVNKMKKNKHTNSK